MLHKPWKTIKLDEMHSVDIYGNNRDIEIFYERPEWAYNDEDLEPCFRYKGDLHFLSDYEMIDRCAPEWMKEFDCYRNDSFFSGTLVKYTNDGETVRVYTFIT